MKNLLFVIALIVLVGNQEVYSQSTLVKGKIVDYQTGEKMLPVVKIQYTYDGGRQGAGVDKDGNFELKLESNTGSFTIEYPGNYYGININNISIDSEQFDFGEIKMVRNHLLENVIIGGPSPEVTKDQIKKDKKLKEKVLRNYRIIVNDKKLKPYFSGYKINFDFK